MEAVRPRPEVRAAIQTEEPWRLRLARSLRLVQQVSRMAGRELPIEQVASATEITGERDGVFVLMPRETDRQIDSTRFTMEPKLLSGIADSAHAVVAGDLTINFNDNGNDHRGKGRPHQTRNVAAKCFYKRERDDRLTRALTEVRLMEELHAKGRLTMIPVALAITPENSSAGGSVTLVTEYDPTLISLDNMPWNRGLTTDNQLKALLAVRVLAVFNHDDGILHGDAKIKNVAQDQIGRLGMIDYETSHRIDPTDPNDASEAAYVDFGKLLGSLYDKGFLRVGMAPSTNFANLLAEEYLKGWSRSSDDVQEAVYNGLIGAMEAAQTSSTAKKAEWSPNAPPAATIILPPSALLEG